MVVPPGVAPPPTSGCDSRWLGSDAPPRSPPRRPAVRHSPRPPRRAARWISGRWGDADPGLMKLAAVQRLGSLCGTRLTTRSSNCNSACLTHEPFPVHASDPTPAPPAGLPVQDLHAPATPALATAKSTLLAPSSLFSSQYWPSSFPGEGDRLQASGTP
jgi:hypothetical protein